MEDYLQTCFKSIFLRNQMACYTYRLSVRPAVENAATAVVEASTKLPHGTVSVSTISRTLDIRYFTVTAPQMVQNRPF